MNDLGVVGGTRSRGFVTTVVVVVMLAVATLGLLAAHELAFATWTGFQRADPGEPRP